MAKDPAFLFYYQDFIFGTTFMNNEEVGAYIKSLCFLADKGVITAQQISIICNNKTEVTNKVIEKLEFVEDGVYCSKRLTEEVEKRKAFTESRRQNREAKTYEKHMKNICSTYDKHMEDINENINKREDKFREEVLTYSKYPTQMLNKFISYWTEPNKSKTKMRYELERTWDTKRRLDTWARNNFDKDFTRQIKDPARRLIQ